MKEAAVSIRTRIVFRFGRSHADVPIGIGDARPRVHEDDGEHDASR